MCTFELKCIHGNHAVSCMKGFPAYMCMGKGWVGGWVVSHVVEESSLIIHLMKINGANMRNCACSTNMGYVHRFGAAVAA